MYMIHLFQRLDKARSYLRLFVAQFTSPIILILLVAAGLSLFFKARADAIIIFTIIFLSGLLQFWQEKGAADAVEKLLSIVKVKAMVRRDGREYEIPVEDIIPGDIIILNAGDVIPGDSLITESKDLYVDEAALTGETYPVEKQPAGSLFMGTHVISGTAVAKVIKTGKNTEFGKVSERLEHKRPETEFERGVRRFGYLLIEVTLLLVILIFAINVYFNRPVLEAFLFSLALAVGLTPQLLPAIIGVNLAHGARKMADKKVIVKRLASIENFGSMNILCADKTGTLTEGKVELKSSLNIDGTENDKVFLFAYLNSMFETGFTNPMDETIRKSGKLNISDYRKLDEVPYDFIRKRLSIMVNKDNENLIITKGSLERILEVCATAETAEGKNENISGHKDKIINKFKDLSRQGFRTLGIAYKPAEAGISLSKENEVDMIFLGFLVFYDPPKAGIADTIRDLNQLGISLKIITGDDELVAGFVARQVGIINHKILKGSELDHMSEEAMLKKLVEIDIFAEVEPNHKEMIILALRKSGNVVGFLGDGINDASALHAADVGLSVDSAVDVAKEAADIVLLEKDLEVLIDGVEEGRKTFANTLKYVFMATSANFGNMFSMAGASLFLPFLPLLTKQILLMNFLTDLPEMTIATDSVDLEMIKKPRRWDINFIRRFMLVFGSLSSIFDFATFGVLLLLLHANIEQFRTGWFMESVISASMIVLVIRTRKPFWQSRPSLLLFLATVLVVIVTLTFPLFNLNKLFGFSTIPIGFVAALAVIMAAYIISAEILKKIFYSKISAS